MTNSSKIELIEWKSFFNEKKSEFTYSILKNDFEYVKRANKKHKDGLAFLQENQMLILESMLTKLLGMYSDLQKQYDYPEEVKPNVMPDITDLNGFADLLTLNHIYVISVYKDEIPYIGFLFSCSWEPEHALGVMMHKERVIEIDDAETAFSVWAAEKDLKQSHG